MGEHWRAEFYIYTYTPNVLESCLSPHLDFPHDPHNSGKRLFDKRFFGTQLWQQINLLNGTLICSYQRFSQSNISRNLKVSPQHLAQPSVDLRRQRYSY